MSKKIIASEAYEKILLEAAGYSGNKKKHKRIISASSLSSTMLQLYLKYQNGNPDNQTRFEANSLGSIYQLGVDKAFENKEGYESSLRLEYELSNGWIVSGEMDQIDHENKFIFDNKVSTSTTVSKVRSEGSNNGYALQMAVYRFLVWKNTGKTYGAILPIVDKGHSAFKSNKNTMLSFVEVETHSLEETELILLEKTNQLQEYIDLDTEPDECTTTEKWFFGRKGSNPMPMKCIHFCDQKNNCKHFRYGTEKTMDIIGL